MVSRLTKPLKSTEVSPKPEKTLSSITFNLLNPLKLRSRFNFLLKNPGENALTPMYSRFVKCDKSQGTEASPVFATGETIS
jgi:hypothetical protein